MWWMRCFNPRSRTGNDLIGMIDDTDSGVSIHVPARGTTSPPYIVFTTAACFNPRSRTGNDSSSSVTSPSTHTFQSTFPHGERPKIIKQDQEDLRFQSTFPHGERRLYLSSTDARRRVSIHVPARGTTKKIRILFAYRSGFNPRSRTGNDSMSFHVLVHRIVSIHVPARGTTGYLLQLCLKLKSFNPRSRTGNDSR